MRYALIAALALTLHAPASAQTAWKWTPDQRSKFLKDVGKRLYDANWNCEIPVDVEPVDASHFGDVFKVTCLSATFRETTKPFHFRVTWPKNPLASAGALKVEPWE